MYRSLRFILPCLALAATVSAQSRRTPLINQAINENRRVTLAGNVRPEAIAANDRGAVADNLQLDHILMQLKRSPAQEAAAREFVEQLNDPKSVNYHQWITAAEYGARFGVADEDSATISRWLESRGFAVHNVRVTGMLIDFSGTAGQVRSAFHTEIHNLMVNGAAHIANMTDPQIPAALAPAIAGIVSLHNFMPQPMIAQKAQLTVNANFQVVVPGDLATIYNLNPAFAAGYTGLGQKIVVVEDSNVYSMGDWSIFRKTFGLSIKYSKGSFSVIHPSTGSSGGACTDPGVNGDDGEAILDAEWATAAAPNAAIIMATCKNTALNFGGFIALENILTTPGPVPQVVSISYGDPESDLGAANNAYINSLYQVAVAEGVSVFVSSGDSGAAGADQNHTTATHGINVSGFASTPYNVAVGGTDFQDSSLGTNAIYWNAANGPLWNSAKSYVPEIPWNDSCASKVIATFLGFANTFGSTGFCNSATAVNDGLINTAAGSGGPSGCATGNATTNLVVSGTCAGYAKPSWQAGLVGNPTDGVRDLPDVSLFAANGVWGHYFTVCYSDIANGGSSCLGTPDTWSGFGGTSVSTPIMAGIQALINQKKGAPQGNPNPALYALAKTAYGVSGNASCNSSLGNGASGACTFYDVTAGDMDVVCTGVNNFNCYRPSGLRGVLSTSTSAYQPAYGTNVGWDFATGIGSVNAFNLIMNWP
jgi:subtilase family serine protease